MTREGKAFKPTELGEVTTKLMKERFPKIVNVKFTAQVEDELDAVQRGNENWVDTLQKFYDDFDKTAPKGQKGNGRGEDPAQRGRNRRHL